MLELKDITKRVGVLDHVSNVSLRFERGSLNVLLGPTLSGKTTLMRLMAGLDKPTSGDILVDEKSVRGQSVRKRNVAMVYQQFINYPGLTVYENIASPMRLAKLDKKTIDHQVRNAANLLKLEPYLDRTPLSLSGGQQQRTAIARALVKGADLVLLDEPLANLDYKLREELRVELPKIFAQTGSILIYATTEPQEALLLGGKTATLSQGRVTQFGNTIDVYSHPVDLETAQIFADPPLNITSVTKSGDNLQYQNRELATLNNKILNREDGQFVAALRPHHIGLKPTTTATFTLSATVSTTEITGSETFIHVKTNDEHWVVLTRGVHKVEPGQNIMLHIDPEKFYLFDQQNRLILAPDSVSKQGK